ncbi:MAG: hypothetical protein IJ719_07935 [Clostridia bacterium]|nr:hypothetical protein [Clostridia bacterium]
MSLREHFQFMQDRKLIPSEKDVREVKRLMAKDQITASDWKAIIDILRKRALLTICPMKNTKYAKNVSGILCEGRHLMAFTNFEDCDKYLETLAKRDKYVGSGVVVGTVELRDLLGVANYKKLDFYIDIQEEPYKRFIEYLSETEQIRASWVRG